MFRNVIFYLTMILLTIPLCALAIFCSIKDRVGIFIHKNIAVPWSKILLKVSGVKVHVKGLENIQKDKQYIFATNHQSYFDILALLATIPVPFAFIMKEELMEIPLFGKAMEKAGYVGISREDPRKAILGMKRAEEKVREGFSLVIFPEGTRSLDGSLGEFKRGAFNLALKTRLDLVPVAIRDSYKIVKKGTLRINRGCFSVEILEPISSRGVSKRGIPRLVKEIRDSIQRRLLNGPCLGCNPPSL